jgi:response regulator RpfG family c-di-GMP phosphodiesterase
MPLSFLAKAATPKVIPWKVLIVDDEEDIHHITQMALKRFTLDDKSISYLNAYSASEAKEILSNEKDIALIFLDVVMETDDAGLQLAKWIRQDLGNKFSRIVLRTGQPGQAPEERVIVDYDINDYKEKTELDRKKLFTTVYSSLRAYRDIIEVETARKYQEQYRNGLERVIESTSNVLEQRSLTKFFSGLLQQIMSLLRIEQRSVLLQITGIGAVYSKNDFKIIAQISDDNGDDSIDQEAYKYLNMAIERQESIFENDVLVGYFPSQSEKVSLLYLKGITSLSKIDTKLLEIFSGNVSLAFDNLLLNREVIETQEELIYRLGDVVESRSNEAGNHIRRMSEVSYMLAQKLGMPHEEAELLKQAAPMHDIGKIATPDKILLKPGKLDYDEMEEMKRHPSIGFDILKGSERPILKAAAIISEQHHEKFDGTGYPNKLKGENIHIYARIVAVADVFDALTHKRCYKEAWAIEDVIDFFKTASGNHLDPEIVTMMLDNVDLAIAINNKYADK